MEDTGEPTRVVAITPANVARVQRWRGVRSGIRTYLQARVDGEWCQVVETRSDPGCLPPRSQRLRGGGVYVDPFPPVRQGQCQM